MTIVHVANAGQLLANGQNDIEELDYPYFEQIGLIGRLEQWRKTWLGLLEQLNCNLLRQSYSAEHLTGLD